VRHAYPAKGTDLLEGVQEYSGRKFGKITTYTPEEMAKLLVGASKAHKRMVPSLVLGAFANLRTAEISRIDWRALDFDDDGRKKIIFGVNFCMSVTRPTDLSSATRPRARSIATWTRWPG
jgi:hypothetical protein